MNLSIMNNKQKYVSWKGSTNNIIISRNIKNTNSTNSDNCKSGNCKLNQTKFNARPLKHYRKEYSLVSNINSKSANSYINVFDKPGNYIVTQNTDNNCYTCDLSNTTNLVVNINKNNDCISYNKYYDAYNNKIVCNGFNPKYLVIKQGTTNLDKNYSNSNKQLLEKKCKTYLKNLPVNSNININNGTMQQCDSDNCKRTFNPSNKKYNNQGPITSSSRTAALRYCNQDVDSRRCYIKNTYYNSKVNLSGRNVTSDINCNNNCKKIRRINMLA